MEFHYNILILFAVGLIAGFLNVVAGGGSALSLPALIFLGLDSVTANGTNRIAIIAQSVSAIVSFKKENYSDVKMSMLMSAITLPGAVLGALLATTIKDELFNIILGIVNIGIIITMFLPKVKSKKGMEENKITLPLFISLFLIGFYGGFIQVGVGFMIMAALQHLLRLDLISVNMHKVFLALVFTLPAFIIFLIIGKVNFILGLTLSCGNIIGAWQGAKLSVRKGEKFIKYFLVVAILIISLKLFGLY